MKSKPVMLQIGHNNPKRSCVDFLCVGAQKAGTTWLDRCLRKHPHLSLPPIKEMHFWDSFYSLGGSSPEKFKANAINRLQKLIKYRGVEDHANVSEQLFFLSKIAYSDIAPELYLKLLPENFAGSRGEITPEYALLNREQWQNIRNVVPEYTKIIFIMRNPVQRAWSGCRMYMRNLLKVDMSQMEETSLVELVLKKRVGWLGPSDLRTNYIDTCAVLDQCFSNCLYLSFDDICLEPEKLLRAVCKFLQVEYNSGYFSIEAIKKSNVDPNPCIMPSVVNEFLYRRYEKQIDFVNSKFGSSQCFL